MSTKYLNLLILTILNTILKLINLRSHPFYFLNNLRHLLSHPVRCLIQRLIRASLKSLLLNLLYFEIIITFKSRPAFLTLECHNIIR